MDLDEQPSAASVFPFVTGALAIANVLVWLFTLSLEYPDLLDFVRTYGLIPADMNVLAVFSSMFLHTDFWHLAANVYFLAVFGNIVESALGSLRFTAIYLGGGLIATIAHCVAFPDSTVPLIGASGGVATLMGVVAFAFPHAPVNLLAFLGIFALSIGRIYVPAGSVLLLWFLVQSLNFMLSSASSGVAWAAHVFGFITGAIVASKYRQAAIRAPQEDEFDA